MIWTEKAMRYVPWLVRNESVHLKAPERSIPRWVQGKSFFRQTQKRGYKK